jgi:hypothetical protein
MSNTKGGGCDSFRNRQINASLSEASGRGARCVRAVGAPRRTATEKLRIVWLEGLARRDREWPLNEGQLSNPNVVRAPLGTGYHRVEGNRRASRNGPRERSPTRNPYRYDSQVFHRWCTSRHAP